MVDRSQLTSSFSRPRSGVQRSLVRWMWFGVDLLIVLVATVCAALLSEGTQEVSGLFHGASGAIVALIAMAQLLVFQRRGLYRTVVRYSGIETLVTVAIGVAIAIIVAVVTTYFLRLPNTGGLGRTFLVIYGFSAMTLSGGARLVARMAIEQRAKADAKPVLIYGSGSLAEQVLHELRSKKDLRLAGLLDDDPARMGAIMRGCKVLGRLEDLPRLLEEIKPVMLVIAERNFPQARIKSIFQVCMDHGVRLKTVDGSNLNASASMSMNDLALEDLLRRPPRKLDRESVKLMLDRKRVIVTGGGGSIGSELCRQIGAAGAREIIVIDHSEFNLYQINNDLRVRFPKVIIRPILATLSDYDTLDMLMANHRPHIIFHAAAYKHVPMVEENPFLGMANNLGGFANLLKIAIAHRVEQLVMISTDKAVRPTNVMGASKRACEVLMQNIDPGQTRLCAVRFGNVLGSSGSVIPYFLEQIRRGGPVTVTHPEVTRYFMLLPEAVELVLQAGAIAHPGEIFILDMGEPVRIVNLARQLIFMTGHVPDRDILITFSGLRPGEKLYEELLIDDTENSTKLPGITIARSTRRDYAEIAALVHDLLEACSKRDLQRFIFLTSKLVPEWIPSAEFNDFSDGATDAFRALGGDGADSRRSIPSNALSTLVPPGGQSSRQSGAVLDERVRQGEDVEPSSDAFVSTDFIMDGDNAEKTTG
jgi:FlaA1/EpsC-like NDP-sugar epimerase